MSSDHLSRSNGNFAIDTATQSWLFRMLSASIENISVDGFTSIVQALALHRLALNTRPTMGNPSGVMCGRMRATPAHRMDHTCSAQQISSMNTLWMSYVTIVTISSMTSPDS
jgi:hypothetical protein